MSTDFKPLTTEHLPLNSEEFVEQKEELKLFSKFGKRPAVAIVGMHGVGSFGCDLHIERELVKAGYETIPLPHTDLPEIETFQIKPNPIIPRIEYGKLPQIKTKHDGSSHHISSRAQRRKEERDKKKGKGRWKI